MKVFDSTMTRLEQVLDLRAARHKVIAANIANEETPGYRAKDLPFGEALASALRGEPAGRVVLTHVRHLEPRSTGAGPAGVRLTEVPAGEAGADANTVHLEFELAKMADNAMNYNAAATIIALRFQQLLAAIRGAQ